jgi:hypothetical protein
MRVFISYAREDKDIARKLYQDLKSAGVEPWMDEYDLLVGQNWKNAITNAIEQSDFFLALLSSRSLSKRGYVQKELRRAVSVLEEMPPTDVYILPVRLDDCRPEDERLKDLNWADLFPEYDPGLAKLIRVFEYQRSLCEEEDSAEAGSAVSETDSARVHETPMPPYDLRSTPMKVSDDEFKKVFRLDNNRRPLEYIQNDFHDNGDSTVTDRATGLTWQKSGSPDYIPYKERQKYIDRTNRDRFAGYSDWRLPTVDELASLLEPEEKNGDLYIDPVFDEKQRWCWSADERASGGAWDVYFDTATCTGTSWASATMSVRFAPDNVGHLVL